MQVIKLGEMVDKPQAKRVQMMERQAEEMRRINEARERDAAADVKAREERQRQDRMNQRAYETCAPLWRSVKARATSSDVTASPGDERRRMATARLAKRLLHRAELR